MNYRTILAAMGISVLSGCAIIGGNTGDYLVRGEAGAVFLTPDGDLALSNTTTTSKNSLKDLGLDDNQTSAFGKVALRLGSNEFILSGFQADFSGTGTITATFGSITAGTSVNSKLDITDLKFIYNWYLIDLPIISVGPSLGIDYIDMDAEAFAPVGSLTEEFSVKAPIPVPGVAAELRLGPLNAFAQVNAITAHAGDFDGTFIDAEGGLKFTPVPHVDATLGYRILDLDASGTDGGQNFDANYRLPGFFFSVAIRF